MRLSRSVLTLAGAVALASSVACGEEFFSGPTGPTPLESQTFATTLGVNLSQMTKTAEGVYYSDKTVGTGATVARGDSVRVWYIGWLPNGGQFDTNRGATDPNNFSFRLGTNGVIQGFSLGIEGMKVGGRRLFVIPSSLAYGNNPPDPRIPRYANLVFDVELLTKHP